MRRSIAALAALAALACGRVQGGSEAHARPGDAAPRDTGSDEPKPDVPPRCPPVEPADLEARFSEKRIAVGTTHTCGIRNDGTVECWGDNLDGESSPPSGTFVRLSAGEDHTCGIRTSGEVECWGAGKEVGGCDVLAYETCGQSLPPPGRFIEIAAGDAFTCGLRPDFTIECWGANVAGETEPPCGQFVQMSATSFSACAVDPASQVECWPRSTPFYGEDGMFELRDEPVRQVSFGSSCACILYATGEADCRLLSPGPPWWARPWQREGVAAVACGDGFACVILDDGTVDWGTGEAPVDGTFSEISCGWSYCCGLRTNGTAACWGGTFLPWEDVPPDFPGPKPCDARRGTCPLGPAGP